MTFSIKIISILAFICGLTLAFSGESELIAPRPRNIILMIGDGMGLSQISASMYAHQKTTVFEQFPITGLIATHSSKQLITDSGAGATAFSCGCKTFNGAIGVDAKKKPCPTLIETADSVGFATGIVVSCSITHATPASFYAHVNDRANMEDIALWLTQNRIDYIVGGGSKYFNQRKKDQRDLIKEMKKSGYQVVQNRYDSLPDMPLTTQPFCWFTDQDEPPSALKNRRYLPEMTKRGLSFLEKRGKGNGFFMVVEGSQIDWAGHSNNRNDLLAEMNDFEQTIQFVIDYAKKDGNTLVVVTADHETGGMSILQGSNLDSLDMGFKTKGHTATMVPVFAFGPGSSLFGGLYQNNDLFNKIKQAIGWN